MNKPAKAPHRQSLKAWAVQHVLFPLHERLKGHQTVKLHQQLMATQWYTLERLKQIQLQRLHSFLQDISCNVPYYQDYKARVPSVDEFSLEDLQAWPLISKGEIRDHQAQLRTCRKASLQQRRTGGSTGEPLSFLLGKRRISVDVAQKWRATRWWGVDLGDKEYVLWGSPIESRTQSRLKRLRDFMLRTELDSVLDLDETKALACLKRIQHLKPRMLFAYPSILSYVAQVAHKHHISLPASIDTAFVTSEVLEPYQRQRIEDVFQCRVANGYGGRESGFIAHQCPAGSLHLSFEDILVEILDQDGSPLPPKTQGEIVITHTATQEFPFVRYKTGDLGAISYEPCSCGRGLPVLEQLEGRMSDLIYHPGGGVIHRSLLIQQISQYFEIEQFRFEQFALDHSKLYYTGSLSESSRSALTHQLKRLLGEGTAVELVDCDTLPRDLSGKHRFVVSHLNRSTMSLEEELKRA